MRLWPRQRIRDTPPNPPQWDGAYRWAGEVSEQSLTFQGAGSLEAPGALLDQFLGGFSSSRISRAEAMRTGAVTRARNLIAGVPATLPLELRNSRREQDERNWLGIQPNPEIETTVMLAHTFEDLFFEGKSYWRVTRFNAEGFPLSAEHLPIKSVSQHANLGMPSELISEDLQFSPRDPVFVDGVEADPRTILRFVSPNPPFLVHAASAIRQVLFLDRIASNFSQDPLPYGYFTDADEMGEEDQLADHEVKEMLDKWEQARKQRRWGYVASGLKLNTLEWPNPEQLQIAQGRNHAILEVARHAGLDPEDVGVNIQGTSRTYQNAEQRRLDLIDFVLSTYLRAVEDRLSMDDITARGLFAKFDVAAFTRADYKTRMEADRIGIESGALRRNEARRREGKPDLFPEEEAAADGRRTGSIADRAGSNGNG